MTLRRVSFVVVVIFLMLGTVGFAESRKNVILSVRSHDAYTQTVECLGPVDMEFDYHQRITEWSDGNGGYHYSWQGNISQFRAVDAAGNEYGGGEAWTYNIHVASSQGFPYQEVLTMNTVVVSRGAAPNSIFKWRLHVTINAPGVATASWEFAGTECIPE